MCVDMSVDHASGQLKQVRIVIHRLIVKSLERVPCGRDKVDFVGGIGNLVERVRTVDCGRRVEHPEKVSACEIEFLRPYRDASNGSSAVESNGSLDRIA